MDREGETQRETCAQQNFSKSHQPSDRKVRVLHAAATHWTGTREGRYTWMYLPPPFLPSLLQKDEHMCPVRIWLRVGSVQQANLQNLQGGPSAMRFLHSTCYCTAGREKGPRRDLQPLGDHSKRGTCMEASHPVDETAIKPSGSAIAISATLGVGSTFGRASGPLRLVCDAAFGPLLAFLKLIHPTTPPNWMLLDADNHSATTHVASPPWMARCLPVPAKNAANMLQHPSNLPHAAWPRPV